MNLTRQCGARASVLGLAFAAIMATSGQAPGSETFRALAIDGAAVRWRSNTPEGATVLRFAIMGKPHMRANAVNCGRTQSPEKLLARSKIDRGRFDAAVAQAFAQWQRSARLRFIQVERQQDADIVIGEQVDPSGHAFTNLELGGAPHDSVRPIVHATVCLNPQRHWKIGFDGDFSSYDLVHTLTHEIGHAIGLDHPGARGHVMSFRYDEANPGLTAGDVLGAQTIYGAAELRSAADGEPSPEPPAPRDAASSALGRGMTD